MFPEEYKKRPVIWNGPGIASANIYLLKVYLTKILEKGELGSKLTIKAPEQRPWCMKAAWGYFI